MRAVLMTAFVAALPLAGCANNPYALKQENNSLQQSQAAIAQRSQELQSRASTLDHDNQELQTLLAQTRQQSKVLEDQLTATREQLHSATNQMAQLRDEKQLTQKQADAIMASTRRRTGAQITANNSLERNLSGMNLPGVEVRVDGDVVRVELPNGKLFQPGAAVLQPTSTTVLDTIAFELARVYPDQKIGIEGHTDGDLVQTPNGFDPQQLSVARANAVYQHLARKGAIATNRMFLVGYGSNQPIVSNATAAGKARNSRVELVVYPERVGASR